MDYNSLFFLLGNVAGFFLKKAPWYPTKFVPGAVFVFMALSRLLLGLGIEPAQGGEVALAGWAGWALIKAALLDTLKAVALHSITKNSVEGLKKGA